MNTKKISLIGLCVALALVLSYIESLIPPLVAVPGIKVGLPNVIIVFALYKLGAKEATLISVLRLLLVALLFGNALTFFYSFAGAVLSLILMIILQKVDMFSTVGVSVAGGVAHNAGQITVACLIMETSQIALLLPILILSGVIAGVAVGLAGHLLINRIKRI